MLVAHLRSMWATNWATRGVAQLSEGLSRDVAPSGRNDRPERRKPSNSRAFVHAPKRTRTSTRLSRTRPSTWRVYQFRHRREEGEYSPGHSQVESVRAPLYLVRTHVRETGGAAHGHREGPDEAPAGDLR